MPEYQYEYIETGQVITVYQSMNEVHEYNGSDGTDKGKWRRYWSARPPEASVDSVVKDPHSAKEFIRVTRKSHGNMGDLWDRSAELSAMRADKEGGRDPQKESFYGRFKKKHAGKSHPQQVREQGESQLAKLGVRVDWGDRA